MAGILPCHAHSIVTSHSISDAADAVDAAQRFFAPPLAIKMQVKSPPHSFICHFTNDPTLLGFLARRASLSWPKFVRIYRARVPNKQTPFIAIDFLSQKIRARVGGAAQHVPLRVLKSLCDMHAMLPQLDIHTRAQTSKVTLRYLARTPTLQIAVICTRHSTLAVTPRPRL